MSCSGRPTIISLIAVLLAATPAISKDRITWGISDFPPSFIVSGPWAGKGTADETLHFLTERLEDYEHSVEVLSVPRMWNLIARGDGFCAPAAFKTEERSKLAVFSRATLINFTPTLLVRKAGIDKFARYRDAAGGVDLNRVITDGVLTGAYQTGRSYGSHLDRVIATAADNHRLTALQDTRQALEMVIKSHADFTFGFPHEITYLAVERNIDPGLVQLPVAGQPRYTFGHVACSNGPVGRKVVARVNEILGHQTWQLPYIRAGGRWYDPDDMAELLSVTEWPH
jgi:uncharacterized protein (TIGR02285 family)